jgi:hypothetical protein
MSVVSPATTGSTVSITADTWTRIDVSFTSNTTTTAYSIETVGSTQPFYLDDVLLEQTSELRPHFDGATADALGWDYGWTGTANASTSTAKALSVSGSPAPAGYSTSNSTITSSYGIKRSGDLSAYVAPSTNAGGLTATLTTVASTAYTFSVWVYATSAKNIILSADSTTGTAVLVPATTWTRLSLSFTSVDTSTLLSILGTDSTVAFYVDDAMLQASSTLQTYFDGDTDATSTTWPVVYSWAGTPHASISTREVGETLPPAGAEILPPYGAASREQSEAQLQIRYRSGWLG